MNADKIKSEKSMATVVTEKQPIHATQLIPIFGYSLRPLSLACIFFRRSSAFIGGCV
jgi:hypothetical protein